MTPQPDIAFTAITMADSEERFLRPRALKEASLDSSTWSDATRIWMADPEKGYVLGKLAKPSEHGNDSNAGAVVVVLEDGRRIEVARQRAAEELLPVNAPRYDRCEDMATMGELNEATVLHNLQRRYSSNLIHTYSGLFLVILNPYRPIPIYTPAIVEWYRRGGGSAASHEGGAGRDAAEGQKGDKPPHIFAVANAAYRAMIANRQNQSILITGESGAGKTENTKRVIQFLASSSSSLPTIGDEQPDLADQIIATNPILEAFGNAQTIRNNNSSRFGKFVRIGFDATGSICGASIDRYLLEKGRVTSRSVAERSFHIFYQLLSDRELCGKLRLDPDHPYVLLRGNRVVEGVDDAADFEQVKAEQAEYFSVLAAILLLGELCFVEDASGQALLEDDSKHHLSLLCSLLQVDEGRFEAALLNPVIKAGRELVSQARDVAQVSASVEALCRAMYERMFGRLVDRLNASISHSQSHALHAQSHSAKAKPASAATFIGVLDIAGFEIFTTNSLEQLAINYTNERLQQFFNHHMFVSEQAEYEREDLPWTAVDYGHDLQPTIDLLERTNPVGILPCLDEACVLPKSTDASFTGMLASLWRGRCDRFEASRFENDLRFAVRHYAGRVDYSTVGWIEKNKDPLNENIARLLASGTNASLAALFSDYSSTALDMDVRHRGAAFRTVVQRHRESLAALMSQLLATRPHFVRCIVPNGTKQPGTIDAPLVLHQLRCNGVLEGIRICRSGYPSRLAFADFVRMYGLLAESEQSLDASRPSTSSTPLPGTLSEAKIRTKNLLDALAVPPSAFAIGKTRVFFRAGQLSLLDEQRDRRLSSTLRSLQAACRQALAKRAQTALQRQQRSIESIQRAARALMQCRRSPWWCLFQRIRPMLVITRADRRIGELQAEVDRLVTERDSLVQALRGELAVERERLFAGEIRMRGLECEAQQVQRLLLEATEQGNVLSESITALEGVIEGLKQQAAADASERDQVIVELRKELSAAQEALAKTGDNLKATSSRLQEGERERERLIGVEHALRTRTAGLEGQVEELCRASQELAAKLCRAEQSLTSLQEQVERDSIEAEHQKRQRDVEHEHALKSLRAHLESEQQARIDEADSARRKLQRELAQTSLELDEEHRASAALKEHVRRLETDTKASQLESELRAQGNWKRERERMEARAKDLQRMLAEGQEREEALHGQLGQSAEVARLLRVKAADLEDALVLVEHQKRTMEGRLENAVEQSRESSQWKQLQEKQLLSAESRVEGLEGRVSALEDERMALVERSQLADHLLKLAQAELADECRRCEALRAEKVEVEAQVKELQMRLIGGGSADSSEGVLAVPSGPATQTCIASIKAQLESAAHDRQGLLGDVRRLERSVRDLTASLADREHVQLSLSDAATRAELRARKLQTRVDELEQAAMDAERLRRRLERELGEERDRVARQVIELQRARTRPSTFAPTADAADEQ